MSSSSCACSLRRTTLMVFTPRCFAMAMSWRPSVDPAAPCRRYSPCGTFRVSKNPYAVTAHAIFTFSAGMGNPILLCPPQSLGTHTPSLHMKVRLQHIRHDLTGACTVRDSA